MRISDWSSDVCSSDLGRKDRLSASRLNHPDKGTMSGTAMTLRSGPRPADSSANTRRAWRLLTVRISVFSEPDPESPPRSTESTVSIDVRPCTSREIHSKDALRLMPSDHTQPTHPRTFASRL